MTRHSCGAKCVHETLEHVGILLFVPIETSIMGCQPIITAVHSPMLTRLGVHSHVCDI